MNAENAQVDEESPHETTNYKLCCLFNLDQKCGPFTRKRVTEHGLFDVENLDKSTEDHFKSLKLKLSKSDPTDPTDPTWTEKQLIETRVGRSIQNSDKICAYHRQVKGLLYRPTTTCSHPDHPDQKSGTKAIKANLAPLWLVNQVNSEEARRSSERRFPVGGKICFKHLELERGKKEEKRREEEKKREKEREEEKKRKEEREGQADEEKQETDNLDDSRDETY